MDASFQTTHWSMVLASREDDSLVSNEALNALCHAYWKPLYVYLRHAGHPEHDAQDLTQGFLHDFLKRDGLSFVHPEKGRFRSFLIASLKHFVSDDRRRRQAQKRGGGLAHLSGDDAEIELLYQKEQRPECDPERMFDRRWALTVLEETRKLLAQEYDKSGKEHIFQTLSVYLPGGQPGQEQAAFAKELGITVPAVKSEVYRLRKRFGQCLREIVMHTVAAPSAVEDEIRYLIEIVSE